MPFIIKSGHLRIFTKSGNMLVVINVLSLLAVTIMLSKIYDGKWRYVDNTQCGPQLAENDNGTISNLWTRQVWFKNIDCIGLKTWQEAKNFCRTLAHGICGLKDQSTVGSWNIPTKKELQSLLDPGNFSPVLPNAHPFNGAADGCYWVSTKTTNGSNAKGYMYIGDGGVGLGGINVCSNTFSRQSSPRFYLIPIRIDSD